MERIAMKTKIARLAVISSLIWNALLLCSLTSSFLDEKAPIGIQLMRSQGVLLIGIPTLALHLISLICLWQKPLVVFARIIVVLTCGWMLTISILTGLSIGLLMLPSLALICLAGLLLLSRRTYGELEAASSETTPL
jgi:hypothetical protein